MCSSRQLVEAIGRRIQAVIEGSPDPEFMMDEIALAAERGGLVDVSNSANLRRDNAVEFVMDLWYDNPVILDRLNVYRHEVQTKPPSIVDLPSILDALP